MTVTASLAGKALVEYMVLYVPVTVSRALVDLRSDGRSILVVSNAS